MAAVPEFGVLTYNGVPFGPVTRTTGVSIKPVEDAAGRTTVYNQYDITLESWFGGVAKGFTDLTANLCRQALTKNGGPLILTHRAIGDIRVNVGEVRDVMNGPKVRELSFEPAVGGDLMSKLRWSISFCIPECRDAVYKFRAMEFCYTVSYQLTNGYTTRSIQGHIKVPQNRVANGARFPQDSADDYREDIVVPPPEGFRIVYGPFNLSMDRSTLNFSYQHVEMGRNNLPEGVVEATASQTMSTTQAGMAQWQTTISATYEVPKDGEFRDAVQAFRDLLRERVNSFRKQKFKNEKGQDESCAIFPVAMTVTEPEIYGPRKLTFSVTLRTIGRLDNILNSGIWKRTSTAGVDKWRDWYLSVNSSALDPRGYAQLKYDIGEDRIIDLCDANAVLLPQGSGGTGLMDGNLLGGLFPRPDRATSWLSYECHVTVERDDGNSLVRDMPETELTSEDDPVGFDPYDFSVVGTVIGSAVNAGGVGQSASYQAGQVAGSAIGASLSGAVNAGGVGNPLSGLISVISVGAAEGANKVINGVRSRKAAYVITLEGKAARVGFEIPEPALREVNKIPVVPLNKVGDGTGFKTGLIAMSVLPIYGATWRLRYGLEGDLGKRRIEVPRNILFPGQN